jgi:hypothetical protein
MAIAYLNDGSTTMAALAWSDATGFAAGATLVISSASAQTITTAVDQSAVAQIDYLNIRRLFSGTIGSSASPLRTGATGTIWNDAGGGTLYLEAANIAGGGSANTIAKYQHSSPGTAVLSGGTITQIEVSAGNVTIGASVVCTTLYVTGGQVTIEDNATAITTMTITGSGRVICRRQVTTAQISGSTSCTYDDAGTITTLTVLSGSTWVHWRGDVTTAVISGTFNAGNLRANATMGGTSLTWIFPAMYVSPSIGGAVLTQSNVTNILGGYQTAFTGGGGVPVP